MEKLKTMFGKKSYANDRRRLNRKLKQAGIEFHCEPLYDGYKWTFDQYPNTDIIIHFGSYNNKLGLFETMGFPWDDGDVSVHSATELVELLKGI